MSTDIGRITDMSSPSDYRSYLDVFVQSGLIKLHMHTDSDDNTVIVRLDALRLAEFVDFLESAAAHAGIHWPRLG